MNISVPYIAGFLFCLFFTIKTALVSIVGVSVSTIVKACVTIRGTQSD